MKRVTRSLIQVFVLATGLAIVSWSAPLARADAISFQLSSTSLTTTSGGTATFDGTVTNNSGTDLNASDFFFNFFAFDPASVTPNQGLGVAGDFLIPNGATSSITALFDVVLGTVPAASSFPIEGQLEDANGDLSAIQTVTVNTGRMITTPEPATLFMLGAGLLGILGIRQRNKF